MTGDNQENRMTNDEQSTHILIEAAQIISAITNLYPSGPTNNMFEALSCATCVILSKYAELAQENEETIISEYINILNAYSKVVEGLKQ
ncbi:MAG: hypothetical protein IM561_09120 [Microcystis sp. M60BS1]|uniref:hypothetical protein n=1 Tax=unclassified Microcystis TaxID=2643300 RepID=UPI00257D82FC|nr:MULTISPECIES: hypothetical protein [unclassified Microcystis]MCA2594399.1 hypothetical protein [Microcystis sp. M38BS1]MCA6581476.1 hypothetical protein [Pseudanabaena sp. M34BS1SP1A06MG]MCA2510530.1 hypothetical protein [Microcystis sp. M60BS1]MCA2555764.1 hypothetical protein [Microcystis sp. M43BS1]MCA2603407.1 hypothetical protein [Microcystis sp. M26BS1]